MYIAKIFSTQENITYGCMRKNFSFSYRNMSMCSLEPMVPMEPMVSMEPIEPMEPMKPMEPIKRKKKIIAKVEKMRFLSFMYLFIYWVLGVPRGSLRVPGVPRLENFAILNFTVSLGSKLTAKLKKWLYSKETLISCTKNWRWAVKNEAFSDFYINFQMLKSIVSS